MAKQINSSILMVELILVAFYVTLNWPITEESKSY